MDNIKLLLVDKDMNTIIFEINYLQFKSLGLDLSNVKKHDKKRDLNVTITNYLESFYNSKKMY